MPGEVRNIGSNTSRFIKPLFRISNPTMVSEWPGKDQWLLRVQSTSQCDNETYLDVENKWEVS
jgi:hypothetical protein